MKTPAEVNRDLIPKSFRKGEEKEMIAKIEKITTDKDLETTVKENQNLFSRRL